MTQRKSYHIKEHIKSYYWRLTCHEQLENSRRLGVLNNRDPDQHVGLDDDDDDDDVYFYSAWFHTLECSVR